MAKRQVRSLADGEYTKGSWDEVKTIQGTKGVAWNYPWGVTLYGILRTAGVLHESSLSDFVIGHNKIAARFFVYLIIFNVLGQRVRTLVDEWKDPGSYSLTWGGTNEFGKMMPSGQYYYQIFQGSTQSTMKAVLLK